MVFLTFNTVSEFLCLLAAIVFLYKEKNLAWKLFIPFLLLTCSVEVAGIYMREIQHVRNYPVYNLYLVFECGFTSYFFFYLYKAYHYKPLWLFTWLGLFTVLFVTDMVSQNGKHFAGDTATVMSVIFVLASLYYYYLKLKDPKFEPLVKSASFWWVSGTLFFYFGSTVCNTFFSYLSNNEAITFTRSIRYIIFNVLDITMYIFWSYAFICRYRQRK